MTYLLTYFILFVLFPFFQHKVRPPNQTIKLQNTVQHNELILTIRTQLLITNIESAAHTMSPVENNGFIM